MKNTKNKIKKAVIGTGLILLAGSAMAISYYCGKCYGWEYGAACIMAATDMDMDGMRMVVCTDKAYKCCADIIKKNGAGTYESVGKAVVERLSKDFPFEV